MNALAGLRVLIVEDEPILAEYLRDAIAEKGCIVAGSAGTVAQALALVETAAFDVALLDVNLAGELAFDVAAAVVARGRAVVFATGAGPGIVGAQFREWPVLDKPFDENAMFAALSLAAGRRRAD